MRGSKKRKVSLRQKRKSMVSVINEGNSDVEETEASSPAKRMLAIQKAMSFVLPPSPKTLRGFPDTLNEIRVRTQEKTGSSVIEFCIRCMQSDDISTLCTFPITLNSNSTGPADLADTTSPTFVEARIESSACYWAHPENQLPSSLYNQLEGAVREEEKTFWKSRKTRWEAALKSLFLVYYKTKRIEFYVHGVQNSVLFSWQKAEKGDEMVEAAYLAKSSKGLRALLRAQEVPFFMPLLEEKEMPPEDDDEFLSELREFELSHPGQVEWGKDKEEVNMTQDSLLSFRGPKAVRGLYQFLLGSRHLLCSSTGSQEPFLLAPVPFVWSSLVVASASVKTLKSFDSLAPTSAPSIKFRMDMKGPHPLPPWVVSRVLKRLETEHTGEFSTSMVKDTLTQNFDSLP